MGLGHAADGGDDLRGRQAPQRQHVDYKVPTFMDSDVEMKITLVEQAHPEGPYGVKGIGRAGPGAHGCGHRERGVPRL